MNDRYADIKKLEKSINDKGLKYVGKRILTQHGAKRATMPAKKDAIIDALNKKSINLFNHHSRKTYFDFWFCL